MAQTGGVSALVMSTDSWQPSGISEDHNLLQPFASLAADYFLFKCNNAKYKCISESFNKTERCPVTYFGITRRSRQVFLILYTVMVPYKTM